MTIEQTIQKAFDGGYDGKHIPRIGSDPRFDRTMMRGRFAQVVLRPEFWKSFGKAMDWEENIFCVTETSHMLIPKEDEWLTHWHELIDHLAEGGTIESFFETL